MTPHRWFANIMLVVFFQAMVLPVPLTHAQEVVLPAPGVMVDLSPSFVPPHLAGITVYPNSPLKFDFIIQRGDTPLSDEEKQAEYKKLIKYFLASLAVPDDNQWVNLSPYEKDRIVGPDFANTKMGRDLLAQDYILKQITSSLIYPEKDLGKGFWDKVYAQAYKQFGNTNIPVNTFNKVWIVPDSAVIFEKGNSAYVLKNHLKVMLEQDYVATEQNAVSANGNKVVTLNASTSNVMRDVIIPVLEKEVNEGKNFANLRQVYSGMLLAAWYKRVLKESFLAKVYADKSKLKGIDQDPKANQEIYARYLQATKKGVYNFIKEDVDKYTQQIIPRKYFSGGAEGYKDFGKVQRINDRAQASANPSYRQILEGVNVDNVDILFDDMSLPVDNRSANVVDVFSGNVSTSVRGVDFPLKVVPESTEHIDIFSGAVEKSVGHVQIPSNVIQDKEQQDARLAREIRMDPYFSDLDDMGKNMGINMRRLYKYDGTTNKNTVDEMIEILERIVDEVEFKGSKDQIEIYQEVDELSSKFGEGRQQKYLGLKFKKFSVHFNTEANLKALGEKTKLMLQKIIMERAKSRLDYAMIGIQGATTQAANNVDADQAANPVGGIDLNASKLNMQIKRDGNGVVLPLAQQNWEGIVINGLTPVILEIKPAVGLSILDIQN